MSILNKIEHIPIKLASPEKILEWSFGEVTKSETINYRTLKPEKGGLFCERIFGPVKDFRCHCGFLKKDQNRGEICPKCGVEATFSRVRRERMGHIELEEPVAHFWYFRGDNPLATMLDIPAKELTKIIYCDARIVVDPGDTPLEYKQILTELEYIQALEEYDPVNGYISTESFDKLSKEHKSKFKRGFRAGTGAKILKEMLESIDLHELKKELEERLAQKGGSKQERNRIEKRLKYTIHFIESGNKPEWMILTRIPVLPPELRPMVQVNGRFASSDLNEFYRHIINRNSRLKRFKELDSPSILIENEMRLVQESVDCLFDNEKTAKPKTGPGKKPLKSLRSYLSGKQGRFRQNLLGKRVDYSGRSVIVSGPKLRFWQIGLPRKMALELYKPFVEHEMLQRKTAINPKNAKAKIDAGHKDAWSALEEVVKHHPVLLNRAPTLHRLSIRAFEVVLIDGNAIQLHPLMCGGFNADFDGDQMAVHVPISIKAQLEARMLLLSTENLNHPQNGKSANTPSQDMILGCYYMTLEKNGGKGEGKFFSTAEEVQKAYEQGWVDLHSKIIFNIQNNPKIKGYKYIVTTPGKVIFNNSMPEKLIFINGKELLDTPNGVFNKVSEAENMIKNTNNKPFNKSFIGSIIDYAYDAIGKKDTIKLLDSLMDLGFKFATRGGISISLFDIETPENKEKELIIAQEKVDKLTDLYELGRITENYRYNSVIDIWNEVGDRLSEESYEKLIKNKLNNISMMMGSGARGNQSQHKQLGVMRGLMAGPDGNTIEIPIKSNFSEGLSIFEYFTSTHGSRKGMVDTALKTADSGYLTRRMVDVAQDVVVTEDDCKTDEYFELTGIEDILPLEERLEGRFLMEDIKDTNGKMIATKNEMITKKQAKSIAAIRSKVKVRNITTCQTIDGVCSKCYGMDLATRELVIPGVAVGVIAAQSIGEPGTQLTMRTFHTGGVAGAGDITQGLPRIEEIFEARTLEKETDKKSILAEDGGVIHITEKGVLKQVHIENEEGKTKVYEIPYGYSLLVKEGQKIEKGEAITSGSINPHELLKIKGMDSVKRYLIEEVQKVYKTQGVTISDKHIEVIVRQMTKKIRITNPGDSNYRIGQLADVHEVKKLNKELENKKQKTIEYREIVQSIKKSSLTVDSFLSASSFERTSEILTNAAIKGKKDYIKGLKESVILGKLIPAGTGFYEYKKMEGKTKKR